MLWKINSLTTAAVAKTIELYYFQVHGNYKLILSGHLIQQAKSSHRHILITSDKFAVAGFG